MKKRASADARARSKIRRSALDGHRNAHAAADAQRGQPLLGVALDHFVQQTDEHATAGGADGMADGDGAAVHVDLGRIPAKFPVDRNRLGGERLIGLDEIEILDVPAGLVSALREAGIGPVPMIAGSTPAVAHEAMRARGAGHAWRPRRRSSGRSPRRHR